MTISVVITCHNDADILPFCIQWLWSQARRPDQIIVVDDGSRHPVPESEFYQTIRAGSPGNPIRFHGSSRGVDEKGPLLAGDVLADLRHAGAQRNPLVDHPMKILEDIIKECDTRLWIRRTHFWWAMILAAAVGAVAGSLLTVLIQ